MPPPVASLDDSCILTSLFQKDTVQYNCYCFRTDSALLFSCRTMNVYTYLCKPEKYNYAETKSETSAVVSSMFCSRKL